MKVKKNRGLEAVIKFLQTRGTRGLKEIDNDVIIIEPQEWICSKKKRIADGAKLYVEKKPHEKTEDVMRQEYANETLEMQLIELNCNLNKILKEIFEKKYKIERWNVDAKEFLMRELSDKLGSEMNIFFDNICKIINFF